MWLHGMMCSSTGELAPVAVQKPLRNRRSLLVDLLGYGFSDKPEDLGYTLEDHAASVVSLLDALALERCVLVGHSMGGSIATLVAAQRPEVVATLIVAEANLDPGVGKLFPPIAEQTEDEFTNGFNELVESQLADAMAAPEGVLAAHLGMTRLLFPRAVHRVARSLMRGTNPTLRAVLHNLPMPRFYLQGETSDQVLQPQDDLVEAGVTWVTVPDTGHAMGLQNSSGFAASVADALGSARERSE